MLLSKLRSAVPLQPVHSIGSSGYGSLGSNGSHEQLVTVASFSDSNSSGQTPDEARKSKPVSHRAAGRDGATRWWVVCSCREDFVYPSLLFTDDLPACLHPLAPVALQRTFQEICKGVHLLKSLEQPSTASSTKAGSRKSSKTLLFSLSAH